MPESIMSRWLTRDEALKSLNVRPQTLYAYASRGQIGVVPDPENPRRSLYRSDDVTSLIRRRERGRRPEAIAASTISLGEPIIDTAISTIIHGRLYYRGQDAVELSASATLEDAAGLLWSAATTPSFLWDGKLPRAGSIRARAFSALGSAAAAGTFIQGRTPNVLNDEAAELVGCLGAAFGADPTRNVPLHLRLATNWKLDRVASDLIRRTLVLLADQELTASTFAARVTASTGACLGACALAGLAALTGPLHGDATLRVRSLFEEVVRIGAEEAVHRHLASGISIPGFGHPLYTDGDPRAQALLAAFDPPPIFTQMMAVVATTTGQAPNIDMALAALSARFHLPADAPFALFAIGRSVGWLAHSIEQVTSGTMNNTMIRPRARYIGPPLAVT
jgi:citrate synthase